MYFNSLSSEVQNLIMLNFEFFGKKFLLLFAFIFAFAYIFYFKNRQDDTPYIFLAFIRSILYLISYIFVWVFPLFIFLLYPQAGLDTILNLLLLFYYVGFFIMGVFLIINFLWIGPLLLMRFGGFNPAKEQTDEIFNRLFLNKNKRSIKSLKKLLKFKFPKK